MLKVDRSHHQVVLDWFKDDLSKISLQTSTNPDQHGNKSSDSHIPKANSSIHPIDNKRKIKSISSVIDDKMQQKLKFSPSISKITTYREKHVSEQNTDEDSKVAAVTKKEESKIVKSKNVASEHSAASVKAAFKNKRNKIRKQINKLQIKISQGKTSELEAKMTSLQEQLVHYSRFIDTGPVENQAKKYEYQEAFYEDKNTFAPRRRKIRSRQKNIRKDNRPDHMKPPHLRKDQSLV